MARLQDLENKGVAEHWFNKGLQIGSGNKPGEDAPYRNPPKEGDPDYTPPPKFPGQDVPKLQLAHGVTQDGRHVAPTQTYTERTGAVQLPDGAWMMPTKDGKLRPASDEELLEIQYQFEHEHNPSGWDVQGGGWDQAGLYFGEQIPNQKDTQIKDAINKYGKKDGKYQNPEMLIKSLPKA